jgi:hypothetical protein
MSQSPETLPETLPNDPDHLMVTCHTCQYTYTILEHRGFCELCHNPYCNDCSWYDEDNDQIYCHPCIREHDIILTDPDDSEPPNTEPPETPDPTPPTHQK